jgi:hypothetical protein
VLPGGLGATDPGDDPLLDDTTLEFRERRDDGREEASSGRGRVQPRVPERHEADAVAGELVEHTEDVLEAASQPVELPDHDEVEPPGLRVGEHPVQGRSGGLGARHPVVDVLDRLPSTLRSNLSEFVELEADVLAVAGGAHASVEGRPGSGVRHASPYPTFTT